VHSQAYINFKKPEDVIDFYEVFNGHIFVNEKGAFSGSSFQCLCSGPAVRRSDEHSLLRSAYNLLVKLAQVKSDRGDLFLSAGAQYKALVEYAPHQRVPKPRSKKDVREGTITKGKVQMEPWFLFSDMLGFSLIFRDVVRGVNPGKCPVCKKS